MNRRKSNLIDEIHNVLKEYYPTLHIILTEPQIIVRGLFPVRFEKEVLDRYLIEIRFPDDYPISVPQVIEVGNRIKRDIDHHVFVEGNFCLFSPVERWRYWNKNDGLLSFLSNVVNDFFLGQIYYDRYKEFPFGERRHGLYGILDYYAEELGTTDLIKIRNCLYYLAHAQTKNYWSCYCGSGKKLQNCHIEEFNDLRNKSSYKTVRQVLFLLEKYFNVPNS